MTTLASASSMRAASASAEKPPKTTECAAPIRAQASIAIDRLRDHRHVDGDPVALLDAQLQQGVGGLGDLVLELGVGDGAGVARLALEVDGDPVAVAGLDVPVDAVVRDVELAVREPLGERRVRPVQRLGRLLGPGQPPGLLGPEAEPVSLGLLVRLRRDVGVRGELGRRREPCAPP